MACQAGLKGRCTMKNVIYRLDSILCTKSYVGEMKRPVRERLLEHRRAALNRDMQNPRGAHYDTEHIGGSVQRSLSQPRLSVGLEIMWIESAEKPSK